MGRGDFDFGSTEVENFVYDVEMHRLHCKKWDGAISTPVQPESREVENCIIMCKNGMNPFDIV